MYEALYVHIPFCKQRCAYCDFETQAMAQDDARMDSYVQELITSIRAHMKQGDFASLKTIYLGGGTPTYLGHNRLVELAYTLSLSINLEQIEEYTVEANPDSLTLPLVKDLFALGIDRLSLGVQSFVESELTTLGRVHTVKQTFEALEWARERFDNISIDLMCGIPGQTRDTWHHSLTTAIAQKPQHISVYPLQLEEGTALNQAVEARVIEAVDEDTQALMLEDAATYLQEAGYERYEVASYAQPAWQSKHNTTYWTGKPYLGLGTGAASMVTLGNGIRERSNSGTVVERLTKEEAAAEDLMLAMRMSRGASKQMVSAYTPLLPAATSVFNELVALGLAIETQTHYEPTHKGWLLGNELYSRIWDLVNYG